MRIDRLKLKNFRGVSEMQLDLHPHFNLLAGVNGSGKTTILEALTVAMGSLFLGIRGQDSRHIRKEDIRYKTFGKGRIEWQFPVEVSALGYVGNKPIGWMRDLLSPTGRTRNANASSIHDIARAMDTDVRNGELCTLPLLAYYSAGRLWLERKETSESETNGVPGRFRGYYNALQASSQFRHFVKWYKDKQQSDLHRGNTSTEIESINRAICSGLPECSGIRYEFDPDRIQTLIIQMNDGRELPFDVLSDGTRNLIALFADIAHRSILLNPHLGVSAISQTPGIVLIDELDLHLHPQWQKRVVSTLLRTFSGMQFVATSHSPFLLQEADRGKLLLIDILDRESSDYAPSTDQIVDITAEVQAKSLEEIAEMLQGVPNAPWSSMRNEMIEAASQYYRTLHDMSSERSQEELDALRRRLDDLTAPFESNAAYCAFLHQERLVREAKINRGEI